MTASYADLDWFRGLIESHPFQYAKTMPSMPHFYTLRKNWPNDYDFEDVVAFIRKHGYEGTFGRTTYKYLNLNGYRYWTMPGSIAKCILINRADHEYHNVYDEVAAEYDERFSSPECIAEDRRVMDLLGPLTGLKVLDVGSGTGLLLDYKAHEIAPENYTGVDPSPAMRDRFKSKHPDYADRVVPAMFEDFAGGAYDIVVSLFGSISYVQHDYLSRLAEVAGRQFLMFYRDSYTHPKSRLGTSDPTHHIIGGHHKIGGWQYDFSDAMVLVR